MYSYPPEYLLHPVPVLALYGLTTATAADGPKLIDVDEPENPSPTANSIDNSPLITLPSSCTATPAATTTTTTTATTTKSALASSLLNIFTSKSDYTLYEATRYVNGNQTPPSFRVITVSKDYVLPKKPSPLAPNLPPPHSQLSPLSHDSPLYPDGVMTPLWIKKHLYSPSVVVGFYDFWDWQTEAGSPPKPQRETGPLASQVLIDPIEREHDTLLAAEINARRKYFQEKGVKFAAVIVLKERYTDQSIEERLVSIRKQCGLDVKSSFFTIAPGSPIEIQEFVNSLYRALYEPALHFYSNRLKKVRKKKSKLPSPSQVPRTTPDLSSTEPQPLSIIGWILRYDIKAAFFQETKQEIDGALRSYEAAYGIIVEMLSPASITAGHVNLTVHGKRWKEVRALADCINVKICRFHLYLNAPTAALSQLNSHLHMFQSYSPSWGMGEHTFEYWSWLSKQYRIFADIIEAAIQAGYKVPLPTAYLTTSASGTPTSPTLGNNGGGVANTSGCNPGAILQHPGFYYHLAAMCCAERRRRFLEVERTEGSTDNPALQHEKLVDHSSLTIELLTKSYEQFKKYRNGRMTLYLAAEIAGTYYESGKFEMAIKFFERIGKTYRKEKWHMVLTSILRWSLRCAKELGSWERAVECLVELMSDDLPMTENKRNDIQKELFDILTVHPAANAVKHAPLVIHMDQINAFFGCQVQIKKQTNFVGTSVDYQIIVKTNKNSPSVPFRFSAVKILFSNPQYNVILRDAGTQHDPKAVELIDFSQNLTKTTEEGEYHDWYVAEVDLRVLKGQTKALQGSMVPQDCGELKILSVCFDIITPQWQVELKYALDKTSEEPPASRRKWLESYSGERPIYKILDGRGLLSVATVLQKPPSLDLKFEHAAPALLDELFKLDITMTSTETETVEATLVAEIKNSEGVVDDDYVTFTMDEEEEIKAAVQETNVGQIEPGKTITKSVYLHGGTVTGSRLINFTVRYSIVGKDRSQTVEKTDSLRVPFIAPFDANFELCAQSEKLQKSISPELQKSERWLLVAALRCSSTWDLDIKHVQLEKDETFSHTNTVLSLISKMDGFNSQTWKTGHTYNANYLFQLSTSDLTEEQTAVPVGNIAIEWKRSEDQKDQYYKSLVRLPSIQFQQQGLVVVADVPSEIYVGEAFALSYTVYNPTEYLAEYSASIEISEAFVFSGYKQLKGRVLPLSRVVYYYTCYPLLAGKVKLPRLKVMASQQQSGEREVPVEIAGSGISIALDNDLQQKQTGSPSDVASPQPILAFVNAKRTL
ncbi:Gryzun, putative trafficking through golgi-domain-containing protein [Parasitella parasitica]|nr:Gryzun, putative trafficking through golgi-domain-containing protein [Parasitella parasitica]